MFRSLPVVSRISGALLIGLALPGCEALSPSQLWKLNRQPNMDRGDAYFSVPMPTGQPSADEALPAVTQLEAPTPRS
jgi:hypothetical protein